MNGPTWCLGAPPQPPHLTDGHLINIGRDRHLCRPCWHRWNTTPTDGPQSPVRMAEPTAGEDGP